MPELILVSLTEPYLKTIRAKEHLETLRHELDIFRKSQPCKLIIEDDAKPGFCRVVVEIENTPDRIPLIVGDTFYNLRASLDQLVWYLAKLTLPYPRNTQFPILEEPDPRRFDHQTNGVPADASTIIESLQPYHAGNARKTHLLWRLNKMCILDKHMRFPMHSSVVGFQFPEEVLRLASFQNNDLMIIPASLKSTLKSYMALNPHVPFQVVFGDAFLDIECDLEGIEEIYGFVANNVIPRFSRFF